MTLFIYIYVMICPPPKNVSRDPTPLPCLLLYLTKQDLSSTCRKGLMSIREYRAPLEEKCMLVSYFVQAYKEK